jgi:UDP-N-acetylmuramyl tripeptide synthase
MDRNRGLYGKYKVSRGGREPMTSHVYIVYVNRGGITASYVVSAEDRRKAIRKLHASIAERENVSVEVAKGENPVCEMRDVTRHWRRGGVLFITQDGCDL